MRCGNVWLGPDTRIVAEVSGPERDEGEAAPRGGKVLSQSY